MLAPCGEVSMYQVSASLVYKSRLVIIVIG